MTPIEFSDEFDTLVNSYLLTADYDSRKFDEYEKSVFLTTAQEQIVKELYTGALKGLSFEHTEELRRSLDSLIKTEKPDLSDESSSIKGALVYDLKPDTWFIIYESAVIDDESAGCLNGVDISIIPMTHDEYHSVRRNPFRQPNLRKAVRLDAGELKVEIISKYIIKDYTVRYLAKPRPIILTYLGDLTINGCSEETGCQLNSLTHRVILERAVQLALDSIPKAV